MEPGSVLISGAGFAGLSAAWWMRRLGYRVTVVEAADALKGGGTPVDIRGDVIDVVRRMGLLDRIAAESLPSRTMEVLLADGSPAPAFLTDEPHDANDVGWEIERDDLLKMLFERIEDDVDVRFGDRIAEISARPDRVDVTFASGSRETFSLLLGCDGTHSAVRAMCFGEETSLVRFLGCYFSLAIVSELLIAQDTAQVVRGPGATIILNAYRGKTDVAFVFRSSERVAIDRRDRDAWLRLVAERFDGAGRRARELLDEMRRCENVYFDEFCQVRMNAWATGRVALVGDSGYCPSPAAGLGGSMALLGAAALADAFERHPGDFERAYAGYDAAFRPIVERIQDDAVEMLGQLCAPIVAT